MGSVLSVVYILIKRLSRRRALQCACVKILALIISGVFICQQFTYAAPGLWEVSRLPSNEHISLSFQIPESFARIEEVSHSPDSERTIYLIQDAHTNESGQLNLARTLDVVLQNEPIRYVFTEAAMGDNSLGFLREYGSPKEREGIARLYLRRGLLKGSEYLSMTRDHDFRIWGVEDKSLYTDSMETYDTVVRTRENLKAFLNRIEVTIQSLGPKILNSEVQRFHRQHEAYLNEELALTDFFEVLINESRLQGISLEAYPHLKTFKRLRQMESGIDFGRAGEEQALAADLLTSEERELVFGGPEDTRAPQKIHSLDDDGLTGFYSFLGEKLRDKREFPELQKYMDYLNESEKFSPMKVLDEKEHLINDLYRALTLTLDEKRLLECADNLRLLRNLLDLKITPDEFETLDTRVQESHIKYMAGFLNRKIMELGSLYERAIFLDADDLPIEKAKEFYRLAFKRDEYFVESVVRKMDKEAETHAVLITGGFHTPHLKALLKKEGISFVVLTPQVLHETNHDRYEDLLLSQFDKVSPETHTAHQAGPRESRDTLMTLYGARTGFGPPELVYELGALLGARLAEIDRHLGRPVPQGARGSKTLRPGEEVTLNLNPEGGEIEASLEVASLKMTLKSQKGSPVAAVLQIGSHEIVIPANTDLTVRRDETAANQIIVKGEGVDEALELDQSVAGFPSRYLKILNHGLGIVTVINPLDTGTEIKVEGYIEKSSRAVLADTLHYGLYETYSDSDERINRSEIINVLDQKIDLARERFKGKTGLDEKLRDLERIVHDFKWARFSAIVASLKLVTSKDSEDDYLIAYADRETGVLLLAKEILEDLPSRDLQAEFLFTELSGGFFDKREIRELFGPNTSPSPRSVKPISYPQFREEILGGMTFPEEFVAASIQTVAFEAQRMGYDLAGRRPPPELEAENLSRLTQFHEELQRSKRRVIRELFVNPLKKILKEREKREGRVRLQERDIYAVLGQAGMWQTLERQLIGEMRMSLAKGDLRALVQKNVFIKAIHDYLLRYDTTKRRWLNEDIETLHQEIGELVSGLENHVAEASGRLESLFKTIDQTWNFGLKRQLEEASGDPNRLPIVNTIKTEISNLKNLSDDLQGRTGDSELDELSRKIHENHERYSRRFETTMTRFKARSGSRTVTRWVVEEDGVEHHFYYGEVAPETPFDVYVSGNLLRATTTNALGHTVTSFSSGIQLDRYVRVYDFVVQRAADYENENQGFLFTPIDPDDARDVRLRKDLALSFSGHMDEVSDRLEDLLRADTILHGEFHNAQSMALDFFSQREIEMMIRNQPFSGGLKRSHRILSVFIMLFLKDRQMMADMVETFNRIRSRWITDDVKSHLYPRVFVRFVRLITSSLLGENVADVNQDAAHVQDFLQNLTIPGWDMNVLPHPEEWMNIAGYPKDARLWLPQIPGLVNQPYRYLAGEELMGRHMPVKADRRIYHPFDPYLVDYATESLTAEGAVIAGFGKTPFLIFSDDIPQTRILSVMKRLRTVPDYKNMKSYIFPSGWLTGRIPASDDREQRTLLIDNGHLDGVMLFLPPSTREDDKAALAIDARYHDELSRQKHPGFIKFMKDQKLKLVTLKKEWAHLNLANAGRPTPTRDFFIFNSDADIEVRNIVAALGLKEGHYAFLSPENSARALPFAGASTDCLICPIERFETVIPFERSKRIMEMSGNLEARITEDGHRGMFAPNILEVMGEHYVSIVSHIPYIARLKEDDEANRESIRKITEAMIPSTAPLRRAVVDGLTSYFLRLLQVDDDLDDHLESPDGPGGEAEFDQMVQNLRNSLTGLLAALQDDVEEGDVMPETESFDPYGDSDHIPWHIGQKLVDRSFFNTEMVIARIDLQNREVLFEEGPPLSFYQMKIRFPDSSGSRLTRIQLIDTMTDTSMRLVQLLGPLIDEDTYDELIRRYTGNTDLIDEYMQSNYERIQAVGQGASDGPLDLGMHRAVMMANYKSLIIALENYRESLQRMTQGGEAPDGEGFAHISNRLMFTLSFDLALGHDRRGDDVFGDVAPFLEIDEDDDDIVQFTLLNEVISRAGISLRHAVFASALHLPSSVEEVLIQNDAALALILSTWERMELMELSGSTLYGMIRDLYTWRYFLSHQFQKTADSGYTYEGRYNGDLRHLIGYEALLKNLAVEIDRLDTETEQSHAPEEMRSLRTILKLTVDAAGRLIQEAVYSDIAALPTLQDLSLDQAWLLAITAPDDQIQAEFEERPYGMADIFNISVYGSNFFYRIKRDLEGENLPALIVARNVSADPSAKIPDESIKKFSDVELVRNAADIQKLIDISNRARHLTGSRIVFTSESQTREIEGIGARLVLMDRLKVFVASVVMAMGIASFAHARELPIEKDQAYDILVLNVQSDARQGLDIRTDEGELFSIPRLNRSYAKKALTDDTSSRYQDRLEAQSLIRQIKEPLTALPKEVNLRANLGIFMDDFVIFKDSPMEFRDQVEWVFWNLRHLEKAATLRKADIRYYFVMGSEDGFGFEARAIVEEIGSRVNKSQVNIQIVRELPRGEDRIPIKIRTSHAEPDGSVYGGVIMERDSMPGWMKAAVASIITAIRLKGHLEQGSIDFDKAQISDLDSGILRLYPRSETFAPTLGDLLAGVSARSLRMFTLLRHHPLVTRVLERFLSIRSLTIEMLAHSA